MPTDQDFLCTIVAYLEEQKAFRDKTRKYVNDISLQQSNGDISANCNEITFINMGDSRVLLNRQLSLQKGDSISFDGKHGELDVSRYNALFDDLATASLMVIRKNYVND